MAETNRWPLVHAYRRLVEDRKVAPIKCPSKDGPMVSVIDPESNDPIPMFWCPRCDTNLRPGIDMWDQLEAAVNEFG